MIDRDLQPGAIFGGRYRIVQEQGRGGMGMVLLAEDLRVGQRVALKLILGAGGEAEALSLRFRREFRAIQRISHPNVVAVYDYGSAGARSFFTMEFVQGQDLGQYLGFGKAVQGPPQLLALNAPRRLERVLDAVRQTFEALAALHGARMIHRDLKPGNILVNQQHEVKLIDFGLARDIDEGEDLLTRQGMVVGTVEYMAPEQMLGARLDSRCDLYSMGVILFESLAGRRPYEGMMTRHQLLEKPPAVRLYNPEVPVALESLTLKLLQKDPFERFQSAEDFLAALELARSNPNTDFLGSLELSSVRALRPGAGALLLPQRFVGRAREMAALQMKLSELQNGKGDLMLLGGDAGIGKSRLVEEVRVSTHLLGMRLVQGACFADSVAPYGPFGPALEKLCERMGRWPVPEQMAALGQEGRALAEIVPRFAEMPVYQQLPELPALESPEKKRYLVMTAATNLLRVTARRAPLVLVLEDLQWSTALGLELLAHAARSITHAQQVFGDTTNAAPLMILGTYRTDEVEGRPIQSFLRQVRGKGLARLIRLEKLEEKDVAEFVQSMLALPKAPGQLVSRLYQESEGNPFFLEEIMKTLLEDNVLVRRQDQWHFQLEAQSEASSGTYSQLKLPLSIKDAVHRRLERLDPEDLAILGHAATIGRQFSFELLLAATERPEEQLLDWVDRMLKAEILVEDRKSQSLFEFYQDKIREVVVGDLPERKRLFYHRKIALAAEALYASDAEPHLELLSQHFFQAGLKDKALEYAWRAGVHLKRGFHNDAAIVQLRRALSLLGEKGTARTPVDEQVQLDCYQALGEILLHIGENREALECFQHLCQIASLDSAASARAQLYRGIAHSRLGDSARALEDFGIALVLFDQLGDLGSVADCHRETGRVLMFQDRFEEAHAQYKQALDLYKERNDRLQMADVLSHLGMSYYLQNKDAMALEYFQKALPVFEKAGEVKGVAQSRNRAGTGLIALGRLEEAEQTLNQALRELQSIEAMRDVLICQINQGRNYAYLGKYGSALEVHQQAVALARELEDQYLLNHALSELGALYLQIGVPEQAREPLEEALAIARQTQSISREATERLHLATLSESTGDLVAARNQTIEAARLAKEGGSKDLLTIAQIRLLRMGRLQGGRHKLLGNLLERLRKVVSPNQTLSTLLMAAEAFFQGGSVQQAVALAEEVDKQAAASRQLDERMRALTLLSRNALRQGRPQDEAWELCDEALGLAHDLAQSLPPEFRPAFLAKPFLHELLEHAKNFVSPQELAEAFEDLGVRLEAGDDTAEVTEERPQSQTLSGRPELVARSEAMGKLHEQLRRLAAGSNPVFVSGEAGCGKASVAATLHELGAAEGQLVVVASGPLDTASLPGLLEQARGGTLYFPEFNRLTMASQLQLAQRARSLGIFLVCSANSPLSTLVGQARIEPSLARVFEPRQLQVPPLRSRREDILPLAQFFLRRQSFEEGIEVKGFSKAAEDALLRHDWPGNVAELEIQVCRAVLLCDRAWIEPEHLELTPGT